jgi:Na+-translocating ferredoxin:NAD+ oxidoreductase RnfC subunit
MMGRYSDTPDFPVTKTTKGILVLPRDSLLATRSNGCPSRRCSSARASAAASAISVPSPVRETSSEWESNRTGSCARWPTRGRGTATFSGWRSCVRSAIVQRAARLPMGLSPRRVNQQIKKALRERRRARVREERGVAAPAARVSARAERPDQGAPRPLVYDRKACSNRISCTPPRCASR